MSVLLHRWSAVAPETRGLLRTWGGNMLSGWLQTAKLDVRNRDILRKYQMD
jgi:hypothetical protein